MSGGALTDYDHDLYKLEYWAKGVENENPLLAEMLCDLYKLLDRYDYFLSDDIGETAIQEAWTEFRDKWLDMDTEAIEQMLFDKCVELVDASIKGCRK